MFAKLIRLAAKKRCTTFGAVIADTTDETVFESFSYKRSAATDFGKANVVIFGVLRRITPIGDQLIERPFAESSGVVIIGVEAVDFSRVRLAELRSADTRLDFWDFVVL